MGQFFVKAEFVDVSAKKSGLVPILRAEIRLGVNLGGPMPIVNLGVGVEKGNLVRIFSFEPFLYWGTGEMPVWENYIASGFAARIDNGDITIDAVEGVRYELLFPLTPSLVNEIENLRAGGSPFLSFAIRFSGAVRTYTPQPTQEVWSPFHVDQVIVYSRKGNGIHPEIPESKWVNDILPNLGAGEWLLYEIPVESFEGSALVDEYLRNA